MPLSLVHAGKGMVPRRMPVLRENNVLKSWRDAVNDVDDLVAIGHGKRASGTKIILNIDHDQHVRGSRLHDGLDFHIALSRRSSSICVGVNSNSREWHWYVRPATEEAAGRLAESATTEPGWRCSLPCQAADARSLRLMHAPSFAGPQAPRERSGSPPTESSQPPTLRATHLPAVAQTYPQQRQQFAAVLDPLRIGRKARV